MPIRQDRRRDKEETGRRADRLARSLLRPCVPMSACWLERPNLSNRYAAASERRSLRSGSNAIISLGSSSLRIIADWFPLRPSSSRECAVLGEKGHEHVRDQFSDRLFDAVGAEIDRRIVVERPLQIRRNSDSSVRPACDPATSRVLYQPFPRPSGKTRSLWTTSLTGAPGRIVIVG